MFLSLKRRWIVRISSFAAAGILILVGAVLQANSRLNSAKLQLAHRYQAALEELTTGIDNIAISLEKSLYAGTSGGMSAITGELELQAGAVETAISSLPIGQEGVTAVSKFVNQVSDFSSVLLRKAVNGNDVTEQERETISSLARTAGELSTRLDEALTLYNTTENWQQGITDALAGVEVESGLVQSINEMGETLKGSPSLIYDGPFSDHIEDRTSKMLQNAEELSKEQAAERAAEYLSVSAKNLEFISEEHGTMPSYHFGYESVSVSVTKKGGYVSYFRKDRAVPNSSLLYNEALGEATEFLDSIDLGRFEPTYYYTEENVCVINFAYRQGEVICYPDLIKVGVALDNGEIVFYEARGYIMNHSARTFNSPNYTREQAAEVLSPYLKIEGVRQALIPSGGLEELLCYEFACVGDKGEDVLVYVNTATLNEENILILLKTDGGTLTK